MQLDFPGVLWSQGSHEWIESEGRCNDVATSLKYTVMYARFGDVMNPQFKVVTAVAEQKLGSLVFRGGSPDREEDFFFQASVSFLELPDARMQKLYTPPRPPLPIKLPHDFFAPFFEAAASALPLLALLLRA